jgi:nitronate monooxygenase
MMHISDAEFVAACANAGVFACLASAMFPEAEKLVAEIQKIRDLTDRPFGVNISLFPALLSRPVEETLEILAKAGVRILETAGRNPGPYRDKIKELGFLHLHKCARVRDAVKAQALGVDLVAVVGIECGGHPSMEEVTSLILVPQVADHLEIPLIAGGGFSDGRTLVAALALGADGVLMGTRFLATKECPVHPALKEKLLKAQETDTLVIQRSIGNAVRVLRNEWSEQVLKMEAQGADLESLIPFIAGKRTARAWKSGEEDAVFACGQVVGRIRDIPTIRELVTRILAEAREAQQKIAQVFNPD